MVRRAVGLTACGVAQGLRRHKAAPLTPGLTPVALSASAA